WQTATTATVGSSGAFSAYVLPIGPSDRYRAIVPRVGLRAAAVSPVVTVTSTAAPTILTTVLPYAQVNAGYQAQLKISGGGPGTWSAVGLPAGLNLNASTGQISGTPQATGTTTFNVEFTPTSVASVDAQVSIVVGTRAAAPVQAVAGGKSSCRISADTTLWCWGYDESGELGDGGPLAVDPPGVLAPVQIVNKLWTQLTIGGSSLPNHSHACALRESQGFGQCWGGDEDGELGIGGGNSMTAPTTIAGGHLWNELSAGWTNTCGVTTGGALYCWGDDAFGQSATRVNTNVPTRVGTSTAWDQVSSGSTSSCGIRTAGSLWCWGMDARGQLGTGSRTDTDVPTRVGTATSWSQVSVGDGYACAVRTDGTVWCWGSSTSGQLGNGVDVNDPTKDVLAPRQVGAGTNWAQVSAGGGHTCAVTTAGTAWCWGQNSNGELGDGSISPDVTSPVQVGTGADWTSISGGYDDTCGVEAGLVECWGSNEKGKLGIDADPSSTPRVDVPTEVAN
ncbi:MAG: putative Ig domain-containing protein, partial [Nocardioidaceae bacterium]|nr:putative Ig domain-containing protein [Nocardioidaceae bacterium]